MSLLSECENVFSVLTYPDSSELVMLNPVTHDICIVLFAVSHLHHFYSKEYLCNAIFEATCTCMNRIAPALFVNDCENRFII